MWWWWSDSSELGLPLLAVWVGNFVSAPGKCSVWLGLPLRTVIWGEAYGVTGNGSSHGLVHLSKPGTQRERQEGTRSSHPRAGIVSPGLPIRFTSEGLKFLRPRLCPRPNRRNLWGGGLGWCWSGQQVF